MNYKNICTAEAIALIVVIIINQTLLGAAKDIVIDTASSAWFHTIFISIIAIILVLLMSKLFSKFINLDIIDISEFLSGKVLKTIVCVLLIVFFVLSGSLILNHISNCLSVIYLSNTNILFIVLLFLLGTVLVARKDINAISRTNLIILCLLVIPTIILFIVTQSTFRFDSLFPILGYGFEETFFNNTTNLYAFSGLIYLFLITPIMKDTTKYKKVALIAIIISSLYLFFTVTSLLLSFPFASLTEDLFSVYLLSRTISFGSFLERVDAIYVFLWVLSSFSYLSIIFYFLTNTFKKMTNIKNRNGVLYGFASIILGRALIIKDVTDLNFGQKVIFPYYFVILFAILFIILLLAYFKSKKDPVPLK